MSMGDVFAFFGALLALGIALPGMLVAWSLIFPGVTERARLRLHYTPWRCLLFGIALLAVSVPVLGILTGIPAGFGQMLGWIGTFLLLTLVSLGATGLAAVMGDRLRLAGIGVSPHGALLRGAVALEMAAIFPLIGWFVVIPMVAVCSLGAAGFAILHWTPRLYTRPAVQPMPPVQQMPPTQPLSPFATVRSEADHVPYAS